MTTDKRDAAPGQEPATPDSPIGRDDAQSQTADNVGPPKRTDIPKPLAAVHRHCLWCVNGSASEVRHCPATSCPLWGFRFGRKPTAEMPADIDDDRKMYPFEDELKVADFHKNGGSVLNAIKRRCLDCSGGCKSEVRNCWAVDCDLYPFRLGKNPNRKMNPEQRKIAVARLQANIRRKRDGT